MRKYFNIKVIKKPYFLWFHASHKLHNIMAIVMPAWGKYQISEYL